MNATPAYNALDLRSFFQSKAAGAHAGGADVGDRPITRASVPTAGAAVSSSLRDRAVVSEAHIDSTQGFLEEGNVAMYRVLLAANNNEFETSINRSFLHVRSKRLRI